MNYAVADKNNGILETFDTYEQAYHQFKEYVKEGIYEELVTMDDSGLNYYQVVDKVLSFYSIETLN